MNIKRIHEYMISRTAKEEELYDYIQAVLPELKKLGSSPAIATIEDKVNDIERDRRIFYTECAMDPIGSDQSFTALEVATKAIIPKDQQASSIFDHFKAQASKDIQ